MKKVFSLLLVLILSLAVFGCGAQDKEVEMSWQNKEISDLPESLESYFEEIQTEKGLYAHNLAGDILVFASLGEQETDGYNIEIEKSYLKKDKLYVDIKTQGPKKGQKLHKFKTNPYVLAEFSGEDLPEKVVFTVTGDVKIDKEKKEVKVLDIPEQEKNIVSLYFGTKEGFLRKESREIKGEVSAERGKEIVEELIKGTKNEKDTLNLIPRGTKVLDYNFDKKTGLATVDLSKHLYAVQDSKGETLAIYSIVDSLTELEDIKEVQVLIEGEKKNSLQGYIYLKEPLKRDPSLFETNEYK